MTDQDIKKIEAEALALEKSLDKARERIFKTGGPNCNLWYMRTNAKLLRLKRTIDNLKIGQKIIDELTPEDLEIEKRISSLEMKLAVE